MSFDRQISKTPAWNILLDVILLLLGFFEQVNAGEGFISTAWDFI